MQIFSHRGFHLGAGLHENTHAAFERAIASGVDGIETDIQLSADSQPILFHDRLAPDDRPVASLTRRELETVTGYEVPTLDEVLLRWPGFGWNLEMKCAAAAPATIALLQRHRPTGGILLTSFRHDVIKRCATELDVLCGLLVAHAPVDVAHMLAPWQAVVRVRTVVWDFNVLDAELVAEAKACGFKSFTYGAVTPREHELCREWLLDGVITDYPPRGRPPAAPKSS